MPTAIAYTPGQLIELNVADRFQDPPTWVRARFDGYASNTYHQLFAVVDVVGDHPWSRHNGTRMLHSVHDTRPVLS